MKRLRADRTNDEEMVEPSMSRPRKCLLAFFSIWWSQEGAPRQFRSVHQGVALVTVLPVPERAGTERGNFSFGPSGSNHELAVPAPAATAAARNAVAAGSGLNGP